MAMKEVHANLCKNTPNAPKKYMFPKRKNKTGLKKKPLYPCCQCSGDHWNRKCPNFNKYKKLAPKAAKWVEQDPSHVEAYLFYLNTS
jgi:hypothetical protein